MSATADKQFTRWKKYLDMFNIKYSEKDFYDNINEIKMTRCSVTCMAFYRSRYFMILDEIGMEKLRESVKQKCYENRGSMYNVENVMKKNNMTFEEATKEINRRKSLTSGTLKNYIRLYGEEEGKRKFEHFRYSHISSKENFQYRYMVKKENCDGKII